MALSELSTATAVSPIERRAAPTPPALSASPASGDGPSGGGSRGRPLVTACRAESRDERAVMSGVATSGGRRSAMEGETG